MVGPPPPPFGRFEWLVDPALLAPILRDVLEPEDRSGVAVVLGCGTSDLSASLREVVGFASVLSMDREKCVVETMRARRPDLEWRAAVFEDFAHPCRAVFDKSTLDATLAEVGDAAALTTCAHRCLRDDGVYVVVSLYPRRLLEPLVAGGGAFELASWRDLDRCALAVFRRLSADPTEDRERQRRVLDAWFQTANPLLTDDRRRDLYVRWGPNSLALADAYRALFTDAERSVYDVHDFLDDIHNFRKKTTTSGNHATEDDHRLDLPEALAFMATYQ